MLNEKISMSLILLHPGESVTVYCVPSLMTVSAFCFQLCFPLARSLVLSLQLHVVGGKIHSSEPPSVNIHYDHL